MMDSIEMINELEQIIGGLEGGNNRLAHNLEMSNKMILDRDAELATVLEGYEALKKIDVNWQQLAELDRAEIEELKAENEQLRDDLDACKKILERRTRITDGALRNSND
jgi:hypothetical protein